MHAFYFFDDSVSQLKDKIRYGPTQQMFCTVHGSHGEITRMRIEFLSKPITDLFIWCARIEFLTQPKTKTDLFNWCARIEFLSKPKTKTDLFI